MTAGPGVLKLAGGLGTAALVGVSAVAVAADTKPAGAPLRPAVSGAAATVTVQPGSAASAGDLSIPVTPVCQRATSAGAASSGVRAGATATPPAQLDPAVAAALQQLITASTAAQRQAVLATLTPDQRLQLTAYLAARRARGSAGAAPSGGCRNPAAAGRPAAGSVAPDVVDAGPAPPLVVSAVS